jgi:tight adherence protein C
MKAQFVKKSTAEKIAGKSIIDKIDRTLQNTGGARLFIFDAKNAAELFSAVLVLSALMTLILVLGLMRGISPTILFIGLAGFGITLYVGYQKPIDEFKQRLMKDNELPTVVNLLVQGLSVEMPVENILQYIADNKHGAMRDIIKGAIDNINLGIPLEQSLQEAAEKSMNKYFQRVTRILTKSKESSKGLAAQLQDVLSDMEEERLNTKLSHVNMLDNSLFFVVFLGYFLPLIVMILMPMITNMGFLNFFAQ